MKRKVVELCTALLLMFKPPEKMKVNEWADKNRVLLSDSSAEPGKWRSDRTPYMIPIMEAFTDPTVSHIYIMACAQVGKSELLNNCFGYVVDVDPGPVLWVLPTVEAAEDYSKERLAGFIRDTPALQGKISVAKSRDKGNTILKKQFVGGFLAFVGSNAPSGLRSRPIRYFFGDEWDAWARSAGEEGDPAKLAEKRTATFFNRKIVIPSTPTIKGRSRIHEAFLSGTQEEWCLPCPNCGEYHYVVFDDIHFKHEKVHGTGKENAFKVWDIVWRCPDCGFEFDELRMKRQQGKMIARNPDALEEGIRSFRLNAFISPWVAWRDIILEFLLAYKDPMKLQVVYNTLFGEPFEDRGELEDEDTMLTRREEYGAELRKDVLVLTCGVDTQDNRLEYEVVGHGRYGETWGIKKGEIYGRPDTQEVWERLDDVVGREYRYADGRRLMISMTCVDSGGHFTQEVYEACLKRQGKRVFAVKGQGGEGIPFTRLPKQTKIVLGGKYIGLCWLYTIGVDAGKANIMSSLKVQVSGPKYCHFPIGEDCGYDSVYFNGLLSEKIVFKRSGGRDKWAWEKLPGHNRNEALDCRNYAMAAFRILDPDMDAVERRAKGVQERPAQSPRQVPKKKRSTRSFDEW